jgi:hypothetical protein
MLEVTYRLVEDAPPAMPWEEYERNALQDWNVLINGPQATNEQAIHEFLEQNPSFVPGAFSFPMSGHGPLFAGVFTKPPLTGIGMRVPDFMWLATATDITFPMLVEIEAPSKRWFTESGQPRAEFTEARTQLVAWKQWLNMPANRSVFLELYGISRERRYDEIRPQFILVYGRRSEFEEHPEMRGLRANQQGPDEFHVTFDRLKPDYNARDFLTLRMDRGQVTAVVVPPTIRLGPDIAPCLLDVAKRPEAAMRELRMSPERRRFVAGRFAYWDEWVRSGGSAWRGGDCE